jgi:predicted RNase H-like HicB family nuclease
MDQPKYHIHIFFSDEDGGYIANVPALRYCSAFGESYEEALREVLVAMELHLDTLRELGHPIPESASSVVLKGSAPPGEFFTAAATYLEQLLHDPALMEDLIEQQNASQKLTQELNEAHIARLKESMEDYMDFLHSALDDYRSRLEQSQKGASN